MKRNRENVYTVIKCLEIGRRMFEEPIYFYGVAVTCRFSFSFILCLLTVRKSRFNYIQYFTRLQQTNAIRQGMDGFFNERTVSKSKGLVK